MTTREHMLIQRILSGDQEAFRDILSLYEHKVYHFCFRLLKDPHLAEDVTQETFLAIYRHLDQFDHSKPFGTWLFAIAKHNAYRALKKYGNQGDPMTSEDFERLPDTDPSVEQIILAAENHRELIEAIEQLKEPHKQAILLKYFSDFSYKEIAESLQLTEKKVENLLYASKKTLERLLKTKQERMV